MNGYKEHRHVSLSELITLYNIICLVHHVLQIICNISNSSKLHVVDDSLDLLRLHLFATYNAYAITVVEESDEQTSRRLLADDDISGCKVKNGAGTKEKLLISCLVHFYTTSNNINSIYLLSEA